MFRIAIIGASSLSLGKKVIDEILQGLGDVDLDIRLMSTHEDHIRLMAEYACRTAQESNGEIRINWGLDSRKALEGADVVITTFDIGGHQATVVDHDIAMGFGIGQCIGDTLGPGAVMRSQRVIPVIELLYKDLKELAPDCMLINYVNPLGAVGIALEKLGWCQQVGMCSGPAEMISSIQKLLDHDITGFQLAGTNHMSWLISLISDGKDLYPELKRRLLRVDIAGKERARIEILQTFGYFCSESSGQLTDILPWFRNSDESRKAYLGPGYAGETGVYPRVTGFLRRHLGQMNFLAKASPDTVPHYGASLTRILQQTVNPNRSEHRHPIFGNVINRNGRISNLPETAFVETTLTARNRSWIPSEEIPIPEEVVSLSRRHNENNELMASAALKGDPDALIRAMCMDPITSANIGINTIREMTYAYLEREKEWLPQYRNSPAYQGIEFKNLPEIAETVFDGESLVESVRRRNRN